MECFIFACAAVLLPTRYTQVTLQHLQYTVLLEKLKYPKKVHAFL